MMKDFIIRIYRFEKDNPREFVGLVEKVGENERIGFTTMDQLWQIINASLGNEEAEENSGSGEFRKKRR